MVTSVAHSSPLQTHTHHRQSAASHCRPLVPAQSVHHHVLGRPIAAGIGLTGAALLTVSLALGLGAGNRSANQQQQQQPPLPQQQQLLQQQQQQQQQPAMPPVQQQRALSAGAAASKAGPPRARSSQDDLVDHLIRAGLVKTPRVAEALRQVDRGAYVNRAMSSRAEAYEDHPLGLGQGQTISAPHMHAICLELLEGHLLPGARVLDVGAGSGYLTAAMAKLVSPGGFVLGVEKVPELVVHANRALAAANPELLAAPLPGGSSGSADTDQQQQDQQDQQQQPLLKVIHGNVLGDVLASEGPFAAIHVGAAADELHQLLLDKLAPGGRMVIPVGPRYSYQVLMTVDKDAAGHLTTQAKMDVGYVPLTRPSELEDGQLP